MDQQDSGKGAHDKDKQVDLKTIGSLTGNFIENTTFLNQLVYHVLQSTSKELQSISY